MAEPTPEFFRGVAAVPHRRTRSSLDADTGEMPLVTTTQSTYGHARPTDPRAARPVDPRAARPVDPWAGPRPGDTWSDPGRPRAGSAAPPPARGMVVRRRWRSLRAGGEWTVTGLVILLICWGTWTLSIRGADLLGPTLWLAVVLATGAGVFVMARLAGRLLLERALGRQRRTAWPSHLATGVFLAAAGVGFLRRIPWLIDAWTWVAERLP
jgi:hypothetical protein